MTVMDWTTLRDAAAILRREGVSRRHVRACARLANALQEQATTCGGWVLGCRALRFDDIMHHPTCPHSWEYRP